MRAFGRALLRSVANALLAAGVVIFSLSVMFIAGSLMEGVTHRFGEGQVAAQESAEQIHSRLAVIGAMVGAAAVGWTLARLGDSYRRLGRWRPRMARLAAEFLLVLGGAGVMIAVLVWRGHGLAAYRVSEDYRQVGIGAAVGGPILLMLGWLLYRRSARDTD